MFETEKELRRLFDRIDTSKNGKLEFEEVRYALEASGIAIHPSILHAFFDSVDSNHDGVIEFSEWRDFLLLVPLDRASIKNVFQYYQDHAQMTSEGDALVSYDTMNGLGYFTAGGIAGAISRTATAPFDRLKTFLIANTGSARGRLAETVTAGKDAVKAAGKGEIGKAIKTAGSPLVDAVKTIYRAGGIRSFFVGVSKSLMSSDGRQWIERSESLSGECDSIWVFLNPGRSDDRSYEASKRALGRFEGVEDMKQLSGASSFIAGGIAGGVSQFSVYPRTSSFSDPSNL